MKYHNADHVTNYKFISPHDRLYRDCLKNVVWQEDEKLPVTHAIAFLSVLILLPLVLVLLSY